jgi:hypothetical protein
MGGQWWKWPRGEAWELDMGAAIRGTVVRYDCPPHNDWGASVNTTFLGHYKELEEAKRQVEKAIRRDMQRVLEDWTRFLRGEPDELEAAVNEVISTCGGDMRAAIKSLLVANSFLEEEYERLEQSVSAGFARGRHKKRLT